MRLRDYRLMWQGIFPGLITLKGIFYFKIGGKARGRTA